MTRGDEKHVLVVGVFTVLSSRSVHCVLVLHSFCSKRLMEFEGNRRLLITHVSSSLFSLDAIQHSKSVYETYAIFLCSAYIWVLHGFDIESLQLPKAQI